MSTDERVRTAIANWAPRFIANGVDLNDFQAVTQRAESWDDWCHEWSICGATHAALGEEAEAQDCFESAAQHFFQASMAYHFGKFLFVHDLAQLRMAHEQTVLLYQRALPFFEFPGERVEIPFEGNPPIVGILRKPWHTPKPPVVILVPGLDSVKEELHLYGNDFLRRGMAVLAIDGPGQGELEFSVPMRSDYEIPVSHVIDFIEKRADLDGRRVGLFGVSLGGYYAARAVSFERRLISAIALAGPYGVADEFQRMPGLTRAAFVRRVHASDEAGALEKLTAFTLAGVLHDGVCPLLIIMGRQDRIVSPHEAERMAHDAGSAATLWMFDDGNHVCNNIPYRHRPQQADWMRHRLSI